MIAAEDVASFDASPPPEAFAPESVERQRVEVRLSDYEHTDEATDAVLGALASTRTLYGRGGQIVSVRGWDEESALAAWQRAAEPHVETASGEVLPSLAARRGQPVIRHTRSGALDYEISRAVECKVWKRPPGRPKKDAAEPEGRWVRVDCPARILSQVSGVGGDRLPPLEGILQVPSLRPDGSVIDRPGYDEATGYYLASSLPLRRLAPAPTKDSAERALKALQSLYAPTHGTWPTGHAHAGKPVYGFPWRGGWAETVVPIALLLTALARPALGCVPCFVIDASTPGSGKGKTIGVCSILISGEEPARAGWPTSPEEQEKTLGAYAAMGPTLIAWDNVRGTIANTHLENALTTPVYGFRVLGVSEILMLPFRSIPTFTGNNIVMGGDMPRRSIVGRLEPATEHPDRIPEGAFRHPRIEAHARAHRDAYVSAGLTILRAYFIENKPPQGIEFGSFSEWSEIVGGALKWVGAGDITEFSGKVNAQEPEESGAMRRVLWDWQRLDPADEGITLSSAISTLYPQDVAEVLRKGQRPTVDGWEDTRAAVHLLARCPERAIPDAAKWGNGMKHFVGRYWEINNKEYRFVHVLNDEGRAYVPARWKREQR